MAAITEGRKAPSFTLPDAEGRRVSLADFKGKDVVVYFYPRDDTPGCTKEACGFRDLWKELQRAGVVVLGVSADSGASHTKFAGKYDLPFPLLADTGHAVSEKYGAWGEKSLYGRKFMGIHRSTFLIDGSGKVAHVWPKVKVDGHVDQVLEAIREM